MQNVLIKRQIVEKIKNNLENEEIILILGPRQVGKTTTLRIIEKYLNDKKKKVFFFNLDIFSDKEALLDQKQFIDFLKKNSQKEKIYVLIDEIQRLSEPGVYLKGIFDSQLNCKLIVSGSSSLEIKSKIVEPLTGRKKVFYLYPLSFEEFLTFKEPDLLLFQPLKNIYFQKLKLYLDDYIKYGGYPKVVLKDEEKEKIEVLEEIYSSYIEKDIRGFFNVKNETSFSKLVLILASSLGEIINKDFISSSIGSNRQTCDNYIHYLEKSFVIKIIRPFFSNPKKEIIKMPKVYFYDLGLRNLLIKNFTSFFIRQDKGVLFENFVLNILEKDYQPLKKINFWRNRLSSAEVDFVIQKGEEIIPVELKASLLKKPIYSKSMRSFIKTYQPKQAFVVNLNLNHEEKIEKTLVKTFPFWQLSLIDY